LTGKIFKKDIRTLKRKKICIFEADFIEQLKGELNYERESKKDLASFE
jgi:hypothetical protein